MIKPARAPTGMRSFAENRGSPGAENSPGVSCGRIVSRGLAGESTFKFG